MKFHENSILKPAIFKNDRCWCSVKKKFYQNQNSVDNLKDEMFANYGDIIYLKYHAKTICFSNEAESNSKESWS